MPSGSEDFDRLELERQMAAAAERLDFEAAARLRNELSALRGQVAAPLSSDGGDSGSAITTTVSQPRPGAMGLGTNAPVRQPPQGWTKPKRPDPMTTSFKPGGRR